MSASLPTPEQVAASRWYADTGRPVRAVEPLAALPLDGRGLVTVLAVQAPPGAGERYLWLEGDVGQALADLVRDGRPEAPDFTVAPDFGGPVDARLAASGRSGSTSRTPRSWSASGWW